MIFTISCLIALLLLIWFRTDAFLEYSKILHLNSITFHKDFEGKQYDDASLTYHLYLRKYHNCFFVRLITCPICLAVWLGIYGGIATFILYTPIYIIGGLLLFTAIDRLLG